MGVREVRWREGALQGCQLKQSLPDWTSCEKRTLDSGPWYCLTETWRQPLIYWSFLQMGKLNHLPVSHRKYPGLLGRQQGGGGAVNQG